MASSTPSFELYGFFRSSCSGRLRIALNLKSIDYIHHPINLLKGDQHSAAYTSLNPSGTVPLLVAKSNSPSTSIAIGQSLAALEFLEEVSPNRPLLPPLSNPAARAKVRTICDLIACDIQPVTSSRITKRVKELNGDPAHWSRELATHGFAAIEKLLEKHAGCFCVGDEITLADVCLVPAVWAAERVDVDFGQFPHVKRIYEEMLKDEAVQKAHWKNQEDTPEELRG